MLQNLFRNIPSITKNLLIINVLFFLATFLLETRDIDLHRMLGLYYPSSQYFRPYQIATHFFMHGSFSHLFFNMFTLVIFGSHLERTWGEKKYLLFYIITALGAAFLYFLVNGIEVYSAAGEFFPRMEIYDIQEAGRGMITYKVDPHTPSNIGASSFMLNPVLGASGAIYGLIMAFALLFPNTQFMLLFPPIPLKAKWLALGLGVMALYSGIQNAQGDSIAHFAHLGGMLFGFILVKIWQRDQNRFY